MGGPVTSSIDSGRAPERRRWTRLVALFASGLLLAAACTSDDDDATDDETDSTDEATDAAAADLDCPGPEATGDPALVGVEWPEGTSISLPEVGDTAHAAIEYANECLGGIGGRPIEAVDCQIDESSASSAQDCANSFVEAGVVAAAITVAGSGPALVPIITGAGIPYVVGTAASPEENSTEGVYAVTSGVIGTLGSMAHAAQEDGIGKLAILVSENVAGQLGPLSGIVFADSGVEVEVVPVPIGTADMSPQLSAALSTADATAIVGDATLCISYLQATESIDPDGTHYVISTCAAGDVVDAVGAEALDGARLLTTLDTFSDNEEAVLYRAVMEQYAPDVDGSGLFGTGYQVVLSIVRGTAGITDISPAGVAAALDATADVPLPAGSGATFSCSGDAYPALGAALQSVCATEGIIARMDGDTPTDPELFDAAGAVG